VREKTARAAEQIPQAKDHLQGETWSRETLVQESLVPEVIDKT